MLLPTILALFLGLGVILYLRDRTSPRGIARWYVGLAPLPLALSILIPMVMGAVWGFGPEVKWWMDRFSWAGVGLSLVLGLCGVPLIAQAVRRGGGWGQVSAATVLAAGPAAIVATAYTLLWSLGKLWR